MKIHIATDHAGLELKNNIKQYLEENGHQVHDHGAHQFNPLDDYPDFIIPCAKAVSLDSKSNFVANEVLAKHDENYMPPEVADMMGIKPQNIND